MMKLTITQMTVAISGNNSINTCGGISQMSVDNMINVTNLTVNFSNTFSSNVAGFSVYASNYNTINMTNVYVTGNLNS
jgi:hypothetical protein